MNFKKSHLVIIYSLLVWEISCSSKNKEPATNASVAPLTPVVQTEKKDSSCPQNFDCEAQCYDIFQTREKVDQCTALTIESINELHTNLEERLESPILTTELNQINSENFQTIVDMATIEWRSRIRKYSTKDGIRTLNWLIVKKKYTEIIFNSSNSQADDIFPALLDTLDSEESQSLRMNLNGGNLQVLAEKRGNLQVMEWAHDFFLEKCPKVQYSQYGRYAKYACVLKELYCYDGGNVFLEVYNRLNDQRILSFLLALESPGLNMEQNDAQNLKKVCQRLN